MNNGDNIAYLRQMAGCLCCPRARPRLRWGAAAHSAVRIRDKRAGIVMADGLAEPGRLHVLRMLPVQENLPNLMILR